MKFRKLKASEIDARVASVTEKGCSLLLYKDARVDMNILDETVGIMNWTRTHQLIGDRLYCTVSVWDAEKQQWIFKQDVGTESYTEKEKGQASDSFKRACFNIGIGRELYTAPFIWISKTKVNIEPYNNKYTTKDRFYVDSIGYDDDDNINKLVIRNEKTNVIVYQMGEPDTEEQKAEQEYDKTRDKKINKTDVAALKKAFPSDEAQQKIFIHYDIQRWEDMTVSQMADLAKLINEKAKEKKDESSGT